MRTYPSIFIAVLILTAGCGAGNAFINAVDTFETSDLEISPRTRVLEAGEDLTTQWRVASNPAMRRGVGYVVGWCNVSQKVSPKSSEYLKACSPPNFVPPNGVSAHDESRFYAVEADENMHREDYSQENKAESLRFRARVSANDVLEKWGEGTYGLVVVVEGVGGGSTDRRAVLGPREIRVVSD